MKSRTAEDKLKDRLFMLGPKRLLAVSGDGLRGVVSTGLLSELEAKFARRSGRRNIKLSDYFDIIGGAGVGGYIAAQLAMGRRVSQVTESLRGLQPTSPTPKMQRFDAAALDQRIAEIFDGRALDAASLKTGLALVAAPAGGALKVLTNVPRAGEEGAPPPPLLADVVRATVAGPRLEDDRQINLPGVGSKFVDPAMGGASDPAQLLLEAATLGPYGVGWPTGPDLVLVVSVGTASLDLAPPAKAPFVAEARRRTLVSLQALAHAPEPWPVGGELGDMREARLSPVTMWHFVRLDARVDPGSVAELGLSYDAAALKQLIDPNPTEEAALARLHEVGLRKGRAILGDDNPRGRDLFPSRFDPTLFYQRPLGPPRTRLEALGRAFARPIDEDEE